MGLYLQQHDVIVKGLLVIILVGVLASHRDHLSAPFPFGNVMGSQGDIDLAAKAKSNMWVVGARTWDGMGWAYVGLTQVYGYLWGQGSLGSKEVISDSVPSQ